MSAATLERPATTGNGTGEKRLHAFPPGSHVSLCGRTRASLENFTPAGSATRHCDKCMAAARGANPMAR